MCDVDALSHTRITPSYSRVFQARSMESVCHASNLLVPGRRAVPFTSSLNHIAEDHLIVPRFGLGDPSATVLLSQRSGRPVTPTRVYSVVFCCAQEAQCPGIRPSERLRYWNRSLYLIAHQKVGHDIVWGDRAIAANRQLQFVALYYAYKRCQWWPKLIEEEIFVSIQLEDCFHMNASIGNILNPRAKQ